MAKSKRMTKINWEPIGNTICEILTITRNYPSGLVETAQVHQVPYESVVAAAIVQMVSEEVEQQLHASETRGHSRQEAKAR